jgi:hypothetical protein
VGAGGEMTQALYTHINNKKIKIKKKDGMAVFSFAIVTLLVILIHLGQ